MGTLPFWCVSPLDHLWNTLRFQLCFVSITPLSAFLSLSSSTTRFPFGALALLDCFFLFLFSSATVFTNFRKTIAIDLSSVPVILSRQDLARLLLDKFKDVVVKAIQFVPVKFVHITFDNCTTRDDYIHSEYIELEGVNCHIRAVGTQAQQVLIYHYPFEADDAHLKLSVNVFSKVIEIHHQHYAGFNSVCTGTRIVRMDREKSIPQNISVNGHRVKAWYVGRPVV